MSPWFRRASGFLGGAAVFASLLGGPGGYFSPDGRYLGFLGEGAEGKSQVWLLPLGGGEAFELTRAENGARSFRYSRTGASAT